MRSRERLRGIARTLGSFAVALAVCGAGADGWEDAKSSFLSAIVAKNVEAVLDALENFPIHDRPEAALLLIEHGLKHSDIHVYRESEQLLRSMQNPDSQRVVIDAAKKEKSWQLRADCTRVIGSYLTKASFEALSELVSDKRWLVRSEAIRGLGQVREKRAVEALLEQMPAESGRLLDDITDALRKLTGQIFPADVKQWQIWWDTVGKDLDLPPETPEEGEQRERLGTAVARGLYGTVVSERVAFVIDISGSMTAGTDMEGTRFEIAARELVRVLQGQVTPKSQFNIIVFADEAARFKNGLVAGKGGNLRKAVEFVETLHPGGETNAYAALELAFGDEGVDTIYLLSDGSPTVGKETIPALIRRQVDEWNRYRGVKIHCIGFFPGEARNELKEEARTFLMDLARENRGRYTEIE